MIHPYDNIYLNKARDTLGNMLDYAVYSLHQGADAFFELFIASGLAERFECGDVRTVAGMSGAELAYKVLDNTGINYDRTRPRFTTRRSKEYVCGSALAKCQWETGKSFSEIIKASSASDIMSMYDQHMQQVRKQLAEMWPPVPDANDPAKQALRDEEAVSLICDSIKSKMSSAPGETHLKILRLKSGYSQRGLALASGIPLRTIQQYEQRQKNINRARADYIIRLSAVLRCSPDQLLEDDDQ